MKRVAISAGHYPAAPGAFYRGFDEWHEAIVWASRICRLMGDRAVLVPTGTVKEKVEYINDRSDIAFVLEIHFNADQTRMAEGSEALYYPGSKVGKAIAEDLQARMSGLFAPNRGVKEGWFRLDPRNGPIFILKKTRMPAVILEPEFVHNREKIEAMRDAACLVLSQALKELVEIL